MSYETIDSIDRRILAFLQANARESTTDIAKRLGVARTTVHERIAKLERNGTVRGYTVVLNRDPFESYSRCHMLLNISKQKQVSIVRALGGFPEIRSVHVVNGECDLLCLAEVPHLEDLEALVEEVSTISGVEDLRTMIVLATKFNHGPDNEPSHAALQAAAISRGEAG
jgi:DNA-binding Lrp family transcriptional regulator